jgi:hypothetical protein
MIDGWYAIDTVTGKRLPKGHYLLNGYALCDCGLNLFTRLAKKSNSEIKCVSCTKKLGKILSKSVVRSGQKRRLGPRIMR